MCKDVCCRLFVPGYPDIRKVRIILDEAEGMDQKIADIYNEERNKKSDIEFHYPLLPKELQALCGETFPVTRSAKPGSPVCPDCKKIFEGLQPGGDS